MYSSNGSQQREWVAISLIKGLWWWRCDWLWRRPSTASTLLCGLLCGGDRVMRSLVCVYVFSEITIFPRDKEMSRTDSLQELPSNLLSVDDVRWEGDERRRGGKETNFFFSLLHSSHFSVPSQGSIWAYFFTFNLTQLLLHFRSSFFRFFFLSTHSFLAFFITGALSITRMTYDISFSLAHLTQCEKLRRRANANLSCCHFSVSVLGSCSQSG